MLSEIGAQIAVHICLESCGMTNADADSVAQSQNNKRLSQIIKFSAVSDWRFKNYWFESLGTKKFRNRI